MISKLEISLIKTYQHISHPIYSTLDRFHINPIKCRFTPSCSCYTLEAVQKYGALKGTFLGIKRILKCRPGYGGYDPIS
jgi:putative membrane protein insertion efficiency factor